MAHQTRTGRINGRTVFFAKSGETWYSQDNDPEISVFPLLSNFGIQKTSLLAGTEVFAFVDYETIGVTVSLPPVRGFFFIPHPPTCG